MHRIASITQRLHHTLQRLTPDRKNHPASIGEHIAPSTALDVLANKRWRITIEYLTTLEAHNDPVPVDEIATYVAAIEYDCDLAKVTTGQQNRVYIALYQSHLPTMADANIIDYDKDEGLITPTGGTAVLHRAYTAFSRDLRR